ncbi:uncharacterized protein LOC144884415 isoform X1 [Branchiostoma floridae x Branchiostoma japonicum]
MATLKMKAAIEMNADACVVVSGLSDRVNCKKMRVSLQSGNRYSRIKQLVTFSAMGTALVEFPSPKGTADMLANEALLQVRGLCSVIPQDGNVTTLERWKVLRRLRTFLQSLHFPLDHFEQGRQSGASQGAKTRPDMADLDMDADACVVVSGFPAYVNNINFLHLISRAKCIRQAVEFPAAGTVLMEFFRPEGAAIFLANKNRLLEELGLQVKQLETMFSPKEDMSTLQKDQELAMLQKQLETTKQTLVNKEQKLQHVTVEKKVLGAAYRRDIINLKNQREADEREIERLKEQIASLSTEIITSYDMGRDPRGVAIIINNIHFEDMADRDGAEGDTDRLKEVFEGLGFKVVTFHDLGHSKMVDVMMDQGKADHSNYDCFVCCIMSHGTMGKVYSSDDVGIDICELMKPVNAKKCPSLKGKPKLFFIQACQGEKTQRKEGFDYGEYDAKPVPFICHEADFFLGLATVPGYVARRDQDGAPYVHHLAKLLKDFGPTHDLSAIMAMVCDKMNDIHDDKFGWISSNHSTLRKKVVFNTK